MHWWPNGLVVCTFGGFLCLGWADWALQMWGCCRPGLRKCQKWPIAGQKLQTSGCKCQTGPLFFKNNPQKTLFGKPRPPWQVLLRNVQISANLAQNLSVRLDVGHKAPSPSLELCSYTILR